MGSLNPQHSAFQAGKEQTLRKPRSRKEPSSQLKAQLKCPLSGRAFLPLLNFPFPGPHHTYGNYSFLCFSATTLAPAPGPGKAWHTRSLQTVSYRRGRLDLWEPNNRLCRLPSCSPTANWAPAVSPTRPKAGGPASASFFSFAGMGSGPHDALSQLSIRLLTEG